MGNALKHALPRERRFYVKVESTFGTIVHPVGTDAVKLLNFQPGSPTIERIPRADNRDTRSTEEQIEGKQTPAEWSLESYIVPSGSAGVAPDLGPIFEEALGVETIVGGTSVTYSLTDTQGVQRSLSMVDQGSQVLMSSVIGAVVQTLQLKGAGGDPPTIAASGVAKDVIYTGRAAIDGAVVGAVVPVDEPKRFSDNGKVAIYESDGTTVRDDNGGAGFVVDGVGVSDITLSASPSGAIVGDLVLPFQPTPVTAGNPTPGVYATIQTDFGAGAVTIPCLSWEVNINNNHVPILDEVGVQQMSDWTEDLREVTGQFVLRAREDFIDFLNRRKDLGTLDFTAALGTGAGKICTINMPTAEMEWNDVDYAGGDSSKITIPLKGLGTKNELTVAFT